MKDAKRNILYYDLQSKRWYTTHKPDPKGKWDGEHPLAYREYVDGEPQPKEITMLDNERLTTRRNYG